MKNKKKQEFLYYLDGWLRFLFVVFGAAVMYGLFYLLAVGAI